MRLEVFRSNLPSYIKSLSDKEKSRSTINKYSLAVNNFIAYAEKMEECEKICKDCVIRYKEHLKATYKPKTVNLYIVGLNQYLKHLDMPDLCIKSLNIQTNNSLDNCITNDEYKRMLDAAKNGKNITAYYVMRTLACTGMRIKGLSYITVKALKKGNITITNKGKTRSIFIPNKICKELLAYCTEMDIIASLVSYAREKQQDKLMSDFSGGDFPIIMDSPFGNLSAGHKQNVAREIGSLASQVIVIVSDEQWSATVEQNIMPRVSTIYMMRDGNRADQNVGEHTSIRRQSNG